MRVKRGDLGTRVMVYLLAAAVEVSLLRGPVPSWARLLGFRVSPLAGPLGDMPVRPVPSWARRRAAVTQRALARWPWGGEGKCLRRSLVTALLLRSLGPRVHIGALWEEDVFRAHAWVEVCGVLLEPRRPEHVVLITLVRRGSMVSP